MAPATTDQEKVRFNTLNQKNRLRQQMIDSETWDVVDKDNRVRGYEIGKDEYLQVEEEDLDAVNQRPNERPLLADMRI